MIEKEKLIKKDENKDKNTNKGFFEKYFSFLDLKNYRSYFNHSDKEVIQRLKLAVFFQKEILITKINKNPDLFNPIWINISLVLALSLFSNLNEYLQKQVDDFAFNYSYLGESISMVFGYFFIIPTIFFLFLILIGFDFNKKKYSQILILYSYSNIYLILAVFGCFIPGDFINFIFLATGGVFSFLFLVVVFAEYLSQFKKRYYNISILILIGCQSLVIYSYKLNFFPNLNYNSLK